jgi:hypothetical protein
MERRYPQASNTFYVWHVIEKKDRNSARWREIWRSGSEGEAQMKLWNLALDNVEGRAYRVVIVEEPVGGGE